MIGRAALGNPWVFRQIAGFLEDGTEVALPSAEERIDMALEHGRAAVLHDGEKLAVLEMRKHFAWYIKGLHGATAARVRINEAGSFGEIEGILSELRVKS